MGAVGNQLTPAQQPSRTEIPGHVPSVPVRVRHRLLVLGRHGANQERVALALLGRNAAVACRLGGARSALHGLRSATVVPDGWGDARLEVIEAPPLTTASINSHAYELVASVLKEYASSTTVVFCVNGGDNQSRVRPNRFLDRLQAGVGRTVRAVIAVTGCTLALDTLVDLAMRGSRPVVMQALQADPGVIMSACGL